MALLTLDELKARVSVGSAGDEELQDLLDAEEQAIVVAAGPIGTVTQRMHGGRFRALLGLLYTADSVASVTEDGAALAADDWELSPTGRAIRRLSDGTSPRRHWGREVVAEYTRTDDTAARKRVQAQLVRLDLSYRPGLSALQTEGYSETLATGYGDQRDAIIATLLPTSGVVGG